MQQKPFSEREARRLIKLVKEHGSVTAAAAAVGIPRTTLQNSLKLARLMCPDKLPAGGSKPGWALSPKQRKAIAETVVTTAEKPAVPVAPRLPAAPAGLAPVDLPDRIATLLRGKRLTNEQIAAKLEIIPGNVAPGIETLLNKGMRLICRDGAWQFDPTPLQPSYIAGAAHTVVSRADNTFVFGAFGDQHYGSKYSRHEVAEALYDIYAEEGVQCVFNTGNWIDGEARFNVHDITVRGMDAQCRHLADVYPRRAGINTYAVAGDDHEGWYSQREGVDIGRYAERTMRDAGRHDWFNLGYMEAPVRLVNANSGKESILNVVHPGGGSAYALSYTSQKLVESYDGGEKPAALLMGHYHKLWHGNIRNVWVTQTGCFLGTTRIETDKGRKLIKDIAVGDLVMTHRGRYMPVTRLFSRMHDGDMVSISYGRKGRADQTISSTSEHPFLVERHDGSREWVQSKDVCAGDIIFVSSKKCPVTGSLMPYWMNLSKLANPMDLQSVRDKLSTTRGGKDYRRGGSDGEKHMQNDIVPFCEEMRSQGWQIVPVGSSIIPDAVGFKDGRVVAFEIEKSTGRLMAFKKEKYEGAPIQGFVDEVRWVELTKRIEQPRSWYEADDESGFCKVVVLAVGRGPVKGARGRNKVTVYNFSVEEDESYVAGNVVVHNCSEDQTPFMRKKKLEAHVGGALVEYRQDPATGALVRCKAELIRYFNQGYYRDRWSMSGDVTMPPRAL